jgi:hypothetical protein
VALRKETTELAIDSNLNEDSFTTLKLSGFRGTPNSFSYAKPYRRRR